MCRRCGGRPSARGCRPGAQVAADHRAVAGRACKPPARALSHSLALPCLPCCPAVRAGGGRLRAPRRGAAAGARARGARQQYAQPNGGRWAAAALAGAGPLLKPHLHVARWLPKPRLASPMHAWRPLLPACSGGQRWVARGGAAAAARGAGLHPGRRQRRQQALSRAQQRRQCNLYRHQLPAPAAALCDACPCVFSCSSPFLSQNCFLLCNSSNQTGHAQQCVNGRPKLLRHLNLCSASHASGGAQRNSSRAPQGSAAAASAPCAAEGQPDASAGAAWAGNTCEKQQAAEVSGAGTVTHAHCSSSAP